MNEPLNLPKTPTICSRPEETPTHCSFCEQSLDKATFVSLTKTRPLGAICSSCIDRLAVVSQLYRAFSTYYENRPWDEIKDQIWRSMAGEDGTDHAKKVIAALAFRLAQRSASISCDVKQEVDPKTKTTLQKPRIALIGKTAAAAAKLLMATSRITGLPIHVCGTEDVKSGSAEAELYNKCVMDERILRNSVIFVSNGYVPSSSECAIIYCCDTDKGLPAETYLLRMDD